MTFLNRIMREIQLLQTGTQAIANQVNGDGTQYDLLLKDENEETAVLVEIDEKQHFKIAGFFDGKAREEMFQKAYEYIPNKYVIRIRVGEDGAQDNGDKIAAKACIIKSSDNSKVCLIQNEKQFESNLGMVTKLLQKIFGDDKPDQTHYYINFADTRGLRSDHHLQLSSPTELMKRDLDNEVSRWRSKKAVEIPEKPGKKKTKEWVMQNGQWVGKVLSPEKINSILVKTKNRRRTIK